MSKRRYEHRANSSIDSSSPWRVWLSHHRFGVGWESWQHRLLERWCLSFSGRMDVRMQQWAVRCSNKIRSLSLKTTWRMKTHLICFDKPLHHSLLEHLIRVWRWFVFRFHGVEVIIDLCLLHYLLKGLFTPHSCILGKHQKNTGRFAPVPIRALNIRNCN